ncbi:MAG: CDGSH iron-sulfur domain-containing protein [Proteobacteria bacterium]|nr:CDGSH iron-sulfur domain-containing protein [Pseudomonadota bacterium]
MVVEPGTTYVWCSCGKSADFPFADNGCKARGCKCTEYTATEAKEVFFCGCGATKDAPHCDGMHKELRVNGLMGPDNRPLKR